MMDYREDVSVDVEVRFIERESDPGERRYVFAYTITITNGSTETVQLLNRYWRITNSEGELQEVEGPGVVGKQPVLQPGESFRYTSAAILETPVGSMEGHYEFRGAESFLVRIEPFSLSQPNMVH